MCNKILKIVSKKTTHFKMSSLNNLKQIVLKKTIEFENICELIEDKIFFKQCRENIIKTKIPVNCICNRVF